MIRKVLLNFLAFMKIFLVATLFLMFLFFLMHIGAPHSCVASCPCG